MRVAIAALLLAAACGPPHTQAVNRGELKALVPGASEALNAAAYSFGALALGKSAAVDITLTNAGLDALDVTQVQLVTADSGAFFVRGAPGHLAPQASAAVTVTFAPVRAGVQSARLSVQHTANTPAASVALDGTGQ